MISTIVKVIGAYQMLLLCFPDYQNILKYNHLEWGEIVMLSLRNIFDEYKNGVNLQYQNLFKRAENANARGN